MPKKINKIQTISYRIERDDGKPISDEIVEDVENAAEQHISSMMTQGYTSGELIETIRDPEDPDLEEFIELKGWWDLDTKDGVDETKVKTSILAITLVDGFKFHLTQDGKVVDNLDPKLVDMHWDSFEEFIQECSELLPKGMEKT